ncbi:MAG: RNA polymerase-binding protein DksA [Pseudomonadota bacterium]
MAKSTEQTYRPNSDEPFMGERQLDYFKEKLLAWKTEILEGSKETMSNLREDSSALPDLVDRASAESDKALELRTRDRQRKLISKIDAALRRIDDGTYGYCDETGEPIALKRLEARPTATLSLEAQERHERKERTVRDD